MRWLVINWREQEISKEVDVKKTFTRGLVLGLVATMAGIALQCASDPAVIGDGGIVDQFLADLGIKDKGVGDAPVPDVKPSPDFDTCQRHGSANDLKSRQICPFGRNGRVSRFSAQIYDDGKVANA